MKFVIYEDQILALHNAMFNICDNLCKISLSNLNLWMCETAHFKIPSKYLELL